MMSLFNVTSFFLLANLIVISTIDVKTYRIPDALNAILALNGICASWLNQGSFPWYAIVDASLFISLFWLIQNVFKHITGRHGLGTGDVKFAGAAGFWIGAAAIPPFLAISSLTALLYAAVFGFNKPGERMGAIAFAPFLAFSLFTCWLAGNAPILREYL